MPVIPFRDIPFFNPLFCDYVSGDAALQRFFNGSFRSKSSLLAHIEHMRTRDYQRDILADILTKQNTAFQPAKKHSPTLNCSVRRIHSQS